MNLASIHLFCTVLDDALHKHGGKRILIWNGPSKPDQTNACFLVGAYMILKRGVDSAQVAKTFGPLLPDLVSYRDIWPGPQNFELRLEDCWQALSKGVEHGWVSFAPGRFDADEYNHFDHPGNADLHVIVPNKLLAMKGPVDLPDGQLWRDTPEGSRDFSPAHCAEVLADFDV